MSESAKRVYKRLTMNGVNGQCEREGVRATPPPAFLQVAIEIFGIM